MAAEEVVQEVFSQLWSKSDNIQVRTNIKSYLYGAVRNGCLNNLKHQKVIYAHQEHAKHDQNYHTDNFLELNELQDKIDHGLSQLPDKCREIFEMSRFEDKKYKEIAEELNLSIKTVETQMGRALKVMRKELSNYIPTVLLIVFNWIQKYL